MKEKNCQDGKLNFESNLPSLNYKGVGKRHFNGFVPVYQNKANFNLNADSFFKYLGELNYYLFVVEQAINRLMDRNLETKKTKSIEMVKVGDWLDNGNCAPCNYDDIITLYANVILSKYIKDYELLSVPPYQFKVPNAIEIRDDGLYAPDYTQVISKINDKIKNIDDSINNINNRLDKIENDIKNINNTINNMGNKYDNILQKIIDNLYQSGGITNNNINNFEFVRDLVTGNINHLLGNNENGTQGLFSTKSRKNQTLMNNTKN